MKNIRNFCIIAHIDHGKSTLADRMLEITGTIEARKMKDQVLDSMDLERERGITIKMQPVRMIYSAPPQPLPKGEGQKNTEPYILNLIDTPGHIDFSYEVSRALYAAEGAVLLVDATQGVQAQTLTVLEMAKSHGLTIIPAISKVDSPLAMVDDIKEEIVEILGCTKEEIIETSGRTGFGVDTLLQKIVELVPAPEGDPKAPLKALVFDYKYSSHKGIVVFARIMQGEVGKREDLVFRGAKQKFISLETGIFHPEEVEKSVLSAGEIGYIVTGIKDAGIVSVGDTIGKEKEQGTMLPGFERPNPVVWASIFPEDQGELVALRQALQKLKLTDSALFFEEESSGVLGKGFRAGFLGMLHLEIITERLQREFNLSLIVTQPSITYIVTHQNGKKETIYSASLFPEDGQIKEVDEPWVEVNVITPSQYVGSIMPLLYDHEAQIVDTHNFGAHDKSLNESRSSLMLHMPLRELMRSFFDRLKSASSGYASISYKELGMRSADVTKLDILIGGDVVPAFSKVVSRRLVETEAEKLVEKLSNILPRQMFELKIQGKAQGRIISSRTLKAFRKDVTQHMYGGDITRKMKLREKQKKGKKKMKERGKIDIPHDVFIQAMKPE
jgi:GTP-binding protein LepA